MFVILSWNQSRSAPSSSSLLSPNPFFIDLVHLIRRSFRFSPLVRSLVRTCTKAWRYPLPRWGQYAMGCFYFTVPVVGGFGARLHAKPKYLLLVVFFSIGKEGICSSNAGRHVFIFFLIFFLRPIFLGRENDSRLTQGGGT
jgi:hypothetical protein